MKGEFAMGKVITRRDFIRGSTFAVLGAALGFSSQQEKKSKVILVRHKDALDENSVLNAEVIQQMLDEAVMALFNKPDPVEAFKQIIKPGEVVGIKSNVWSYLPTPPEAEKAIVRRLVDVGVKEEDISIDDHNVRTNPIFLKATSLINVRPLRTHYLAGVSGCMKNYIMFAQSQSAMHPNSCSDLGSLFYLPQVKGKTRLNILCALTPQYHGRGPHHFSRRYIWDYKGLIVGQDPVAVDAIGLKLIMAKRTEQLGKDMAVPPVPRHIRDADLKHGLGTSDLNRIDLVKLGWKDDILI
ncbi:MAG: DUF362 domain-containing protein [Candidatus Aminicenantes bacterium]|nr:DUF362 domain-containing protein [Candidatus Aminicenantes bacterium]